jgi:hypothetical protein
MNRDEIQALANEVGADISDVFLCGTSFMFGEDELAEFASRIESLVREECAKKFDPYPHRHGSPPPSVEG